MNLNIGCSHVTGRYRDTSKWVNLDVQPGELVTVGSVVALDFVDGFFEEIHAIHVLEHLNRNDIDKALSECYRVLAPKGVLYVEVPDFKQIVFNLADAFRSKDAHNQHIWTTSIYGKQRYEGDAHHWGFSQETLISRLEKAGNWRALRRVVEPFEMISGHHKQEPVILIKCEKL